MPEKSEVKILARLTLYGDYSRQEVHEFLPRKLIHAALVYLPAGYKLLAEARSMIEDARDGEVPESAGECQLNR